MNSQLETALIGAIIGLVVATSGLVIVWINSRAKMLKLQTQVAESTAAQEQKQSSFILEQARRANESDAARRVDAQELGELKGRVSAMQNQIDAAGIAAQGRDQQIGKLEGLLKAEQEEKQRLLARMSEVEGVARDLSHINADLRQERDRAVADRNTAITDKNDLQGQVTQLQHRVERLELEKTALVKAVIALGGTLPEGVTHDGSGVDLQAAVIPQKTP